MTDLPLFDLKQKNTTMVMPMRHLDMSEGIGIGRSPIVTELYSNAMKAKI